MKYLGRAAALCPPALQGCGVLRDLLTGSAYTVIEAADGEAGVAKGVADYGLERCCFSRVISSGDQSRTSVTSIHASM